ncbi:MAG: hypothetical protein NTX29_09985 [Actinobacteria bacterium]|nr:hypothetical protein [Actinomycetota bacterium]
MIESAWLWVLFPCASLLSYTLWVVAAFTMCGVSGCGGGGFGRSENPAATGVLVLVSGAVAGLPLLVTSWSERRGVRTIAFLAVATLVAAAGWIFLSRP